MFSHYIFDSKFKFIPRSLLIFLLRVVIALYVPTYIKNKDIYYILTVDLITLIWFWEHRKGNVILIGNSFWEIILKTPNFV